MKKVILLFMLVVGCNITGHSQNNIKETFDSNSLEWTESPYKSPWGYAMIDQGKMTVKSGNKFNPATGKVEPVLTETHCYAPIDIEKPFTIKTNVVINQSLLAATGAAGLIFNYRDAGNFYAFIMTQKTLTFLRYEDNDLVGSIDLPFEMDKKNKENQEWTLISEHQNLKFLVNGIPMLNVRYMPLKYTGTGFISMGLQKIEIDDIEFIQ